MDYKARRRYTAVADANSLNNDYPHDIQMYDVPPVGEISLEEFQKLGFDRLKGNLLEFSACLYSVIDVVIAYLCCSVTAGGNDEL